MGRVIRRKAKELINPFNPKFQASKGWLLGFMRRNELSLRVTTTQNKKNAQAQQECKAEFLEQTREIISRYKIEHKYIFNMDETPMY